MWSRSELGLSFTLALCWSVQPQRWMGSTSASGGKVLPSNLSMLFSLEHFKETLEAIRRGFFQGSKSDLSPLRKATHHLCYATLTPPLSQPAPGPTEGRRATPQQHTQGSSTGPTSTLVWLADILLLDFRVSQSQTWLALLSTAAPQTWACWGGQAALLFCSYSNV